MKGWSERVSSNHGTGRSIGEGKLLFRLHSSEQGEDRREDRQGERRDDRREDRKEERKYRRN